MVARESGIARHDEVAANGSAPAAIASARPAGLNEVLVIAAHELRQPAAVIYGLASTLCHQRATLTDEQLDEVVRRLHRQAERLVALLNETLDLDRIQRAEAPPELCTIELASAVERALTLAQPPPGVQVSVAIPSALHVLGTEPGLERVLVNLLSNAYRYGGSHVRIEGRSGHEGVQLRIQDDGPGVPAHLVQHLFQPFRAQPGGNGLGLAIVLALVESFGGTITYRQADPPGAEFDVTLRPDTGPPLSAGTCDTWAVDEPPTILVVDDEPDIRWLLRVALEAAGYRVVEAPDGQAALEAIRVRRPRLVVSDLMMPVMDGNELIHRIRAMPGCAALPIVALSANPHLARNANLAMAKPCLIGDLTRAVGTLLNGVHP
ncbi:MAG TPA: hybrid sensor histidine kinase/response regulator [Actinomycetota bacterium]|nr:hybrid sensor histidine kinase/response regulator [Actinomycetota bacterium]